MTEKQIKKAKFISHVILVGLSMLLSINLFIQFSTKLYVMILFGLMAVAFEIIKLYILILSKDRFKNNHIWAGTAQFALYLGLALMSALASIGFTLSNIEEQSFISKAQNEGIITVEIELEQIDREIEIIKQQIENKTEQINSISNSRGVQSDGLLSHVDSLMAEQMELYDQRKELLAEEPETDEERAERQARLDQLDSDIAYLESQMGDKVDRMDDLDDYSQIDTLSAQIDELNQQQIDLFQRRAEVTVRKNEVALGIQTVSSDVFSLLGSKVGLSGQDTMLYMMLTLVILLEVSIALTSGHLRHNGLVKPVVKAEKDVIETKPVFKYTIIDYIRNLVNLDKNILLPDEKVAKKYNMRLEDCMSFRRVLMKNIYKGRPLITEIKPNFSVENLIKIVNTYLKTGTISKKEYYSKDYDAVL